MTSTTVILTVNSAKRLVNPKGEKSTTSVDQDLKLNLLWGKPHFMQDKRHSSKIFGRNCLFSYLR